MKTNIEKTPIIIGDLYGQTINGTTFKYKLLEIIGTRKNKKWLKVKNVETGHKQVIVETDLYKL